MLCSGYVLDVSVGSMYRIRKTNKGQTENVGKKIPLEKTNRKPGPFIGLEVFDSCIPVPVAL